MCSFEQLLIYCPFQVSSLMSVLPERIRKANFAASDPTELRFCG